MENLSVQQAVKALLAHLKKEKSTSKAAAPQQEENVPREESLYLSIALKKIPEHVKAKPIRIALKHSMRTANAQVALLTKDPQREYKDLIAAKKITTVHKVIGVTKLRNKYKPFEAKRLLCASYDLFLADERILPLLPKLLGKEFYKKKKIPTPVNLSNPKKLKEELELAIQSTYLHLASGPCQTVKVANDTQKTREIIENIMLAIPEIVSNIPKKWKNIQSIHLKSARSLALPIYHELLNGKTPPA